MSRADRFREAVLGLAAGSPYTVEATAAGFDVTVDLADERYTSVFARLDLSTVSIQRIAVDERRGTFTLLDASRTVAWSAGAAPVPHFSGAVEVVQGRVIPFGRQRTHTWEGGPPAADDLDLSAAEGHALVRAAAARTGLSERLPWQAKIGLVVGVGTLVLLAVAAVVVLVLWLTGHLPTGTATSRAAQCATDLCVTVTFAET